MPLPLGSLPKPHPYDRAPTPSYVPLHVSRHVYLCPHPPCESLFQPFQCISTPPCPVYSSPHSALCISNLGPYPALCTSAPTLPGVHPHSLCPSYLCQHPPCVCLIQSGPVYLYLSDSVYLCSYPNLCTSVPDSNRHVYHYPHHVLCVQTPSYVHLRPPCLCTSAPDPFHSMNIYTPNCVSLCTILPIYAFSSSPHTYTRVSLCTICHIYVYPYHVLSAPPPSRLVGPFSNQTPVIQSTLLNVFRY